MSLHFLDFFPYAPDVVLTSLKNRIRSVQLLTFFYRAIQDAMNAFIAKDYNCFDAQVSENLCQIRAYQLTRLANNISQDEINELLLASKNAATELAKCELLLTNYSQSNERSRTDLKQQGTFQDFLLQHQIYGNFPHLVCWLTQIYILSKYKSMNAPYMAYGIDYHMLCNDLNIPLKDYAAKIIHKLQRNIAKCSTEFIFQIINDLDINLYYKPILEALCFNDDFARQILPCYEVTKLILWHTTCYNEYIKIVVKRIAHSEQDSIEFLLKPSLTNNDEVVVDSKMINNIDALTTFFGIVRYCSQQITESKTAYIKRFLSIGANNVLLACMAQHPQYAGIRLKDKKYNPYATVDLNGQHPSYVSHLRELENQFLQHKQLAQNIGCTPKNASLFNAIHVSCEKIIY